MVNNIGLFFILAGVFITILVCAIMPHTNGSDYASSAFVWSEWSNQTGYSSNGFVFLAGMLNGAYAVGTPDCVSHLAEEIPHPKRNVPLAIAAQMVIGFITAFFYMIAIFYAINNIDDVLQAPYFPLATIYAQATSSNGGTMGLLFIIFVPIFCCCIGTYITAGRCLWTISRDGAVPFSGAFLQSWELFMLALRQLSTLSLGHSSSCQRCPTLRPFFHSSLRAGSQGHPKHRVLTSIT
jgi:amino acid transporter